MNPGVGRSWIPDREIEDLPPLGFRLVALPLQLRERYFGSDWSLALFSMGAWGGFLT